MGAVQSRASSEAEDDEEVGAAGVFCGEPDMTCCSAQRREVDEHDRCEDGAETDGVDNLPTVGAVTWPWETCSGLDPADYFLTLAELDVRCHEVEKEVRNAKVYAPGSIA